MKKVTILAETTDKPITLIGERAGVCYGSDITDAQKNYKRGLSCIESGHGRTLEFVNIEMIIDGYSARVIREWYTHLGGSPTRLQASTRYIDYKEFGIVVPPTINTEEKKAAFMKAVESVKEQCKALEKLDVPREDIAMLLPLGMETKILDKRNLRNLIDMSHQRLCTRAYWEYRELMNDICHELSQKSEEWEYVVNTLLVPKCEWMGYCPEAKSCGRVSEKK